MIEETLALLRQIELGLEPVELKAVRAAINKLTPTQRERLKFLAGELIRLLNESEHG